MNKLPYIVFLTIFFVPFSARSLGILPRSAVLLFELISGAIFLIALIYCAYHKSLSVSPKYLILFLIVCLHFIAGAIVNSMDPAVVFAGSRYYIKYMPLFLLPLAYPFSDNEMIGQLKFLMALGLLQVPLALTQFFILDWGPDILGGTFGLGSFMSIFMVSTIIVLTAFYFRGLIGTKIFLLLALLIFIPTTLNESKGTFILLVVGFITIVLAANLKRSQIIMAASTLVIMLSLFIVTYNIYFDSSSGEDLTSFITDPSGGSGILHYLYSGDSAEVDSDQILEPPSTMPGALPSFDADDFRSRRFDSMILPIRALSSDPTRLVLGLGIGNASMSMGSRFFSGQYSFLEENSIFGNAISRFVWEIGILGTLLYLVFFGFILRDARYVARAGGFPGAFALGWSGVMVIVILTLPYKDIFVSETLSALIWYLSGYIAAKRFALRLEGNTINSR